MTKVEIEKELVARNAGEMTLNQAKKVLKDVLDVIEEGLKKDGVVQITGFGTFKAKKVAAREAFNPRNPEEKIKVPAKIRASFTPGAILKKNLNETKKKVKVSKKK